MGATIWVLCKEKMTDGDDFDHSALLCAIEKLDPLCEELGVTKISAFLDWTDFNANMSDEECLGDDEIKNMASWFAPDAALNTLQTLQKHLSINQEMLSDLYEEHDKSLAGVLLEEIDDCIAKLENISAEGEVFHLCVVM